MGSSNMKGAGWTASSKGKKPLLRETFLSNSLFAMANVLGSRGNGGGWGNNKKINGSAKGAD